MTAPASKLLQPITVGPLELKNRIMFPPLTTGYEERDGSIGERSLAFYERLAKIIAERQKKFTTNKKTPDTL